MNNRIKVIQQNAHKGNSRVFAALLILALTFSVFLPLAIGQLNDTSIATLSGDSWSLKIDGSLATDLTSKNVPYISSQKSTEKELFVNLASINDSKSGVVQFKVSTVGLSIYKQLPLDKELNVSNYDFVNSTIAIRRNQVIVSRPENVVNSFAAFDSSGRKVLHIYASKLIDAKGNSIWVDSDLKDGILTVYLDQKFMDSAVYPVIVDPTFGYTSVGASASWQINGLGQQFTLTEDGTVTDLNVYILSGGGSTKVCFAIYDSSWNLIYADDTGFAKTDDAWNTKSSLSITLSSGNYRLIVEDDDSGANGLNIAYDTGADNAYYGFAHPYADPATGYSTASSFGSLSLFANYTATGGSTPTPTPTTTPTAAPTGTPRPVDESTAGTLALIVILIIIIANIILLAIPAALMRFVFGILSLAICGLALTYSFPFSPYLQLMGLLVSGLAMLAASRVRGD